MYAELQINLHYTDRKSENDVNQELRYDCLILSNSIHKTITNLEVFSFCVTSILPEVQIEGNGAFQKLTFVQLSKQNVTSEQLYLWSAPVDLIERYQSYLSQSLNSMDDSSGMQIFYNCTLPRFGPICEYEIIHYSSNYSSLAGIVLDYYVHMNPYIFSNFTCYTHLECERGSNLLCLDWSDICNGHQDCLDGNFDEEHCWQIEINECHDREYQCTNGHCVPESFFEDQHKTLDCADQSDEHLHFNNRLSKCFLNIPTFQCEEEINYRLIFNQANFRYHINLLAQTTYSIKDESVSEQCWSAFKCILKLPRSDNTFCGNTCQKQECLDIIQRECPDMFYIPSIPVLFGEIYLAHLKNDSLFLASGKLSRPFICYNGSKYDEYLIEEPRILFRNRKCVRSLLPTIITLYFDSWLVQYKSHIERVYYRLIRYQKLAIDIPGLGYRSNMYQCNNSTKSISTVRLFNRIVDCPYNDDEDLALFNGNLTTKLSKFYFKCEYSNKYIHLSQILDGVCDCRSSDMNWCEDENLDILYAKRNVSFQTICDGFIQLMPININGRNETDETECHQWSCNNIYTRCDGIWNCKNGEDEIGCDRNPKLDCFKHQHKCVSPQTNQIVCLPLEKVNDGRIDCLGATDEYTFCLKYNGFGVQRWFHCKQNTSNVCLPGEYLCDDGRNCIDEDDERFCRKNRTNVYFDDSICFNRYSSIRSDVEEFLCNVVQYREFENIKYFSLNGTELISKSQEEHIIDETSPRSSSTIIRSPVEFQCHRGFALRIWLNDKDNSTKIVCLCPPSYYGSQCQYQNQRVSLTIKFQALSDSWTTLFAIVISLIDDDEGRTIHSFEQLTYLSVRDCQIKYDVYLLYSTRPKNASRNHSIHIDIYEKDSLDYRGSLLYPMKFPFLPVHRLAVISVIPRKIESIRTCSNSPCVHGICIFYANTPDNTSFCQCDRGWTGRHCNIKYDCTCSSESVCIGVSARNRSVCICPKNRFGYRCMLTRSNCRTSNMSCQHGGQCIPSDEYYLSTNRMFWCLCPMGYSGDRCEVIDNAINLSFENEISVSQSIFIHFIEVVNNSNPKRTTTFRTMPLTKPLVKIYWSKPFHLAFVEVHDKTYYLAIMQNTYRQSAKIHKTINSLARCRHITELFNGSVTEMHVLRRIKHYHLPCQNLALNLSCFYDDDYMCLCHDFGNSRVANCFNFDHNMKFDCLGFSVCENGGQCFQDSPDCPKRSTCICRPCFYGARCQFSSSGFGLSLDAIIGYHIQPNVNFINQPNIVIVSFTLTLLFIVVGLINGILSLITFKSKEICRVGCGLFLLGSSITTLFTTVMFGLKFFVLLFAQMSIISHRSFLYIQCLSFDFLLRIGLNMDQWLNACVALERVVTIRQGIHFDRKKSQRTAKISILILTILMIGANIYDPIYRKLIDEKNDNDRRMWCIAIYPEKIRIFNSFMHIFNFLAPFVLNFASAALLVFSKSQQQYNANDRRSFKQALIRQLRIYKHLLTSPLILVTLAIPRLIISFASKCMKSTNDAWLFLVGYFISFIPPMLTFIIFVLPSEIYKQEFQKSLLPFRTIIQRLKCAK